MPGKTLTAAILAAAALIAQPAAAQCDPGETKIRFSHVTASSGHPKGEAAAALAARVNAEMQGRACMEVYPNSTLYKDNDDLFQALLDGGVEMAAPSISKMSGLSKAYQVFDLPFMFAGLESVIDFQYTPEAQALLGAAEGKGFRGLAYWMNGMRQISADRPLRSPADVQGLRFRVQGSPVEKAYYGLMGGTPVKMAFKDVYGALKSGAVNGQENTWSNIYTKKFYTVQHSVLETNHSVIAYIVVTSSRFLDSLAPADRDQLLAIVEEVTHERNRFAFQLDEINRAKVIENGGKVKRLRRKERDAWVGALKPVWAWFEGEIGPDLIRAAQGPGAQF